MVFPKPAACQICKTNASKYKCSTCQVVYCSVPCFKKHKEESCSHLPPPSETSPPVSSVSLPTSTPTSTSDPKPLPVPITSTSLPEPPSEPIPLRPLSSLNWPVNSDGNEWEGSGNPLDRDLPKPLQREDLMAIATSPKIRELLANPLLAPLLSQINDLPSSSLSSSSRAHSHSSSRASSDSFTRSAFLQQVLGLSVLSPSSSSNLALNSTPHAFDQRGRPNRGRISRGRGGRGTGNGRFQSHSSADTRLGSGPGIKTTSEEMELIRSFALEVERVLKGVRKERRGVEWEVVGPDDDLVGGLDDQEEEQVKIIL
ncbi:Zinc finger, HIT-type [Phaffia rhodozyma]|uniref:Zinc finger, HIT-type n=1 Tax=Phaffia rhodozyma TaxID=264483 RepID=A0A0F7SRQ5_PHARH|nr:Zinc finger, HIT-type [Phaffia rhodozyma]